MGSFTEAVLAFDFKPDAPNEVLAAFSPCRVGDGPELPPVSASWDDNFPNLIDAVENGPLTTKALVWTHLVGGMLCAYFPGYQSAQMIWRGGTWALTTRVHQKETVDWMRKVLGPLGAYACPYASLDEPIFVGYLKAEGAAPPLLVWHHGRGLFEFDTPST